MLCVKYDDLIEKLVQCTCSFKHVETWEDIIDIINEVPTIDTVPVVRCRECKLHTSSAFYPDRLFCQEHGRYVDPDGYCYLGERKEGADNEP